MTSRMTQSSTSSVSNPQCQPSTSLLIPPLPDTLPIVISTQNFQGIFLGVKKGGTWRTLRVPDQRHGGQGHSWHHESIMFFYPKKDTLKISCWYLNWKCVRKGGSRMGVLGGHWGFLTGEMEDRVIPDVINHFFPPWKIPLKCCANIFNESVSGRKVKKRGTWRRLRVPDWRHGWHGHSWLHEWCSFTLRNKN